MKVKNIALWLGILSIIMTGCMSELEDIPQTAGTEETKKESSRFVSPEEAGEIATRFMSSVNPYNSETRGLGAGYIISDVKLLNVDNFLMLDGAVQVPLIIYAKERQNPTIKILLSRLDIM